jgi:hypothetical protein
MSLTSVCTYCTFSIDGVRHAGPQGIGGRGKRADIWSPHAIGHGLVRCRGEPEHNFAPPLDAPGERQWPNLPLCPL